MKKNSIINNNCIYKSNDLIESSYNLTTYQNRLIYLAMTKLEVTMLEKNLTIKEVEDRINSANFEMLFISVTEYKKAFNIKSKSIYTDLVETANSLFNEEVIYVTSDGNNIGKKRWVISCEYIEDKRGIALEFHPKMIRDLLILKSGYTPMFFDNFATKIRGKYTFRIYELCKQYAKIGKREFYIEDLRFKLKINDDEYSRYYDFKKMILSAVNENNKNTDLNLEYVEIEKKNRKVTRIAFIIKPNQQIQQGNMFSDIDENANVNVQNQVEQISNLVGYKVTPQQGRMILQCALDTIDTKQIEGVGVADYIKDKVRACKSYMETTEVKNYIGLLLTALKENWNCGKGFVKNGFNNFEAREYDYNDLEQKLLGWK